MQPIIPRKDWGAEPPWGRVEPLNEPHRGTVVHWEGADGSLAAADPAEQLRSIQQKCKRTGYSDIFYNFAVSLDGRAWECRGWNKNSAANGTTESNDWYYAICVLMGQKDELPQVVKNTVGEMLDHIGGQVWPHEHFYPTACPGDELKVWLALGYPHDVPLPIGDDVLTPTESAALVRLDQSMFQLLDLYLQLQKPGALHQYDARLSAIETKLDTLIANTTPKV